MWAAPACAQSGGESVQISSALQLLGPQVVADWGLGVLECAASVVDSEGGPAVSASFEARRQAVSGLLRAALALPLCGDTSVGEAARQLPELRHELTRMAARADIVSERQETGELTAVARLDLWGAPASAGLLCLRLGVVPAAALEGTLAADEPLSVPVVVDTRDLEGGRLQPSLFPRFWASPDAPLPARLADRVRRDPSAPVRFVRSRDELERLLTGADSTYVRATAIRGDARCDIVVPEKTDLVRPERILVLY